MKRYLFIFVILAFYGQVSAQNDVIKIIHKGLELMDSMAVKGLTAATSISRIDLGKSL